MFCIFLYIPVFYKMEHIMRRTAAEVIRDAPIILAAEDHNINPEFTYTPRRNAAGMFDLSWRAKLLSDFLITTKGIEVSSALRKDFDATIATVNRRIKRLFAEADERYGIAFNSLGKDDRDSAFDALMLSEELRWRYLEFALSERDPHIIDEICDRAKRAATARLGSKRATSPRRATSPKRK